MQGVQHWLHVSFWKKIWRLELPGKVITFIWKVCREYIPTVVALVIKHVQVNIKCSWCLAKNEDATHILIDCSFARTIWTCGSE